MYARFGPSFPGDFIATPDDPQDGNERLREGEPRDLAERNEIVQIAARDHRAQAPAKVREDVVLLCSILLLYSARHFGHLQIILI